MIGSVPGFFTIYLLPMWSACASSLRNSLPLRIFTIKEARAAFTPRLFGTKRNINAPNALKWESFPDERFKY